MSSSIKLFLFFMLLPFLVAVGHDVHMNYLADDEKIREVKNLRIDPNDFLASDLGWIWQKYHKPSMEIARTSVEPEVWKAKVDPILQLPTMVVGIIPFFTASVFLLLAYVIGVWPFSRYARTPRTGGSEYAVYKHAKSKTVKYSKK